MIVVDDDVNCEFHLKRWQTRKISSSKLSCATFKGELGSDLKRNAGPLCPHLIEKHTSTIPKPQFKIRSYSQVTFSTEGVVFIKSIKSWRSCNYSSLADTLADFQSRLLLRPLTNSRKKLSQKELITQWICFEQGCSSSSQSKVEDVAITAL